MGGVEGDDGAKQGAIGAAKGGRHLGHGAQGDDEARDHDEGGYGKHRAPTEPFAQVATDDASGENACE